MVEIPDLLTNASRKASAVYLILYDVSDTIMIIQPRNKLLLHPTPKNEPKLEKRRAKNSKNTPSIQLYQVYHQDTKLSIPNGYMTSNETRTATSYAEGQEKWAGVSPKNMAKLMKTHTPKWRDRKPREYS